MYAGKVIHHLSLKAYSFGDPSFLLVAPLLWFYVVELTGGRVRATIGSLLHFIPFLVIVFCSLSFGSFLADAKIIDTFNSHPRLRLVLFWMVLVLQFSTYQYYIHRKWRDSQRMLEQEVSNTENVSISWVRFFNGVFLMVNVAFLFSLFAAIHLDMMNWIWKLAGMILSLSIFALGYKGILQREIFASEFVLAEGPLDVQQQKQIKSDPAWMDRLLICMDEEKPYLDADLSLTSLSRKLGLNRNQLSQLINENTGNNFYDFVNKYRVEEVKRLMADPQKQNYNLLGLALEAGFKSKSTFNLIFKRFTGLTPTEYKKNIT
jgi:AraC-like DNA-binding protein